jgi:hypothetical protein
MKKQEILFSMCLCLASGSMAACDGVDDASAGVGPRAVSTSIETTELAIGVWPPIQRRDESSAASAGGLAPLGLDALASPAADGAEALEKFNDIEPTEDLVIDWLRWALAQPAEGGAIADATGESCGLGQSGPVWYLAGTFGGSVTRECTVPVGKKLFFPLINSWWLLPPEYFANVDEIDAALPFMEDWYEENFDQATCSLTLRIDGQEVRPDFESLRDELHIRTMDPFEIDLHEEHAQAEYFDGGAMPAVGDGYYALIHPLPPGEHVIELGGSLCGSWAFEIMATYTLQVQAPPP